MIPQGSFYLEWPASAFQIANPHKIWWQRHEHSGVYSIRVTFQKCYARSYTHMTADSGCSIPRDGTKLLLHSLKTLPQGTEDWLYSVHTYKPPCLSTKTEAIIRGTDYNDAVDTPLTKQKLMINVQLSKKQIIPLSHWPRCLCHYRKIKFAFP